MIFFVFISVPMGLTNLLRSLIKHIPTMIICSIVMILVVLGLITITTLGYQGRLDHDLVNCTLSSCINDGSDCYSCIASYGGMNVSDTVCTPTTQAWTDCYRSLWRHEISITKPNTDLYLLIIIPILLIGIILVCIVGCGCYLMCTMISGVSAYDG